LDEDDAKGLFGDVVVGHSEVDGPGEGLALASEKWSEDLKLVIDCVENCTVVVVDCLAGCLTSELIVFELNDRESTISF